MLLLLIKTRWKRPWKRFVGMGMVGNANECPHGADDEEMVWVEESLSPLWTLACIISFRRVVNISA
jgi:hypothetical protein